MPSPPWTSCTERKFCGSWRTEASGVSTLPSTLELIDQKPIRQQLREVRIEDLLGREAIQLDTTAMDGLLSGRTVLVTGGGGSIGSELCRQIVKHHPKRLAIFDIYENNAYDIQQELLDQYGKDLPLSVEIGSVRDPGGWNCCLIPTSPTWYSTPAAHKHVPLMETSPQEAIRNNVFGTLNTVRAADAHGVKKFILISTDKAVNPTSVMGASKRLCEMVVQSMADCSATTFAAVRFGNVLGSNGSVVPLFRRQIAKGGPVTVTDQAHHPLFHDHSRSRPAGAGGGGYGQAERIVRAGHGPPGENFRAGRRT